MQQRMIKAGVLLLGLMILCTIISRTAYNMSIAQVSTERAEARTFTPEVSAQGIVAGRRETAVSTVENLRVGTVYVVEGQTVEAGEVLFEVDLQDLTEKMQEMQLELKALDLQIQSAVEAAEVAAQSRQLTMNQAQEDYDRTAARENAAVEDALAELRQAQAEYQNFIAGAGSGSGEISGGQGSSGQMDIGQAESGQAGSGQVDGGQIGSGQIDGAQAGSVQTAEALRAAVEEKQAAYDQAVQSRDDSLYQAKKSLDASKIGTAKDYSVEQSQMTRGQKTAEMEKLQALLNVQGKVAAPAGGMVTGVTVKTGSTTTGGGDILLSDTSEGASLTVTFPEEMRAYVREGQQAAVTAANGRNTGQAAVPAAGSRNMTQTAAAQGEPGSPQEISERVTIRTVVDSSFNNILNHTLSGQGAAGGGATGTLPEAGSGGSFTVTVDLPADHFSAGEAVTLKVETPSEYYDTCVPTGALHMSGKDQYYVNVAEKQATILGEEWVAHQVSVELLEKNGKYAAVEGISSQQEIVTESTRTLEDGSRVKILYETD